MRGSGEHPSERRYGISRRAALLAAAGGAVTVGLAGCTKNYTYHVKYTVTVQTPEGERTGASVVEVGYSDGRNDPLQRLGMVYNSDMRGKAVVVGLRQIM